MKCINCGHTWAVSSKEKTVTCPKCGLEAEYVKDQQVYNQAVAAEQESRLADAIRDYKIAAEDQIPCAAYGVYRCLMADKTQTREREAQFWLKVAAATDDQLACFRLSRRFDKEDKIAEAEYYLRKAADGNHADACLRVAANLKASGNKSGARYYLEKIRTISFSARMKLLFLKGPAVQPPLTVPASVAYDLLDLAKEAGAKGFSQIAYRLLCKAEPIPQVLFEKALRDLEGLGEGRPLEEVAQDLCLAGEGGYIDAYMTLTDLFLSGEHTPRCEERAFGYLLKAAEAGDREAILQVADSYNNGTLCPVHKEKAIFWYERAAREGSAEAAEQIRQISERLSDTFSRAQLAQDKGETERAFALYVELAEIGHTASACNVGMCYQKGLGVKKDYKQAALWYERAIAGGSAAAACNLGMLYAANMGVRFNYSTAMRLLQAAESSGYKRASAMIAMLKGRRRTHMVRKTYAKACALYYKGKVEEAMRYYATAAKMGNARAMFLVACHAEFGDGLPQSTELANHWYAKAYDAGIADRARIKSGYLRMRNLLHK